VYELAHLRATYAHSILEAAETTGVTSLGRLTRCSAATRIVYLPTLAPRIPSPTTRVEQKTLRPITQALWMTAGVNNTTTSIQVTQRCCPYDRKRTSSLAPLGAIIDHQLGQFKLKRDFAKYNLLIIVLLQSMVLAGPRPSKHEASWDLPDRSIPAFHLRRPSAVSVARFCLHIVQR